MKHNFISLDTEGGKVEVKATCQSKALIILKIKYPGRKHVAFEKAPLNLPWAHTMLRQNV